MPTSETNNKEITRQLAEKVWSGGNLDLIDELIADDFIGQDSSHPDQYHGAEGFKEFVSGIRTAFPDFDVTVKDVIAEDDRVVHRSSITGTHEGKYMGIEPTGTETEVQSIVIFRIEDGQIVARWGQPDMLSGLQQLGVFELPGTV